MRHTLDWNGIMALSGSITGKGLSWCSIRRTAQFKSGFIAKIPKAIAFFFALPRKCGISKELLSDFHHVFIVEGKVTEKLSTLEDLISIRNNPTCLEGFVGTLIC